MLAHRDYQVQDLVGKLKLLQKLVFYRQMEAASGTSFETAMQCPQTNARPSSASSHLFFGG